MVGEKISTFPTSCNHGLAPLLSMTTKYFRGLFFFCSRSMFFIKRSNRKRAVVLCCEEKLQKPIKGKDGTIFLSENAKNTWVATVISGGKKEEIKPKAITRDK